MRKLFFKILAGYLSIIIILSTLILIFSFNVIRESYLDNRIHELHLLNNILKSQVLSIVANHNEKAVDSLVKQIGSGLEVRITIIDTNGVVLGDSKHDHSNMENHLNRPEVNDARKNAYGESLRFSSTVNEKMIYVAIPLKYNNILVGYSRLSFYIKDIDLLLANIKGNIINITLIVALITLIAVVIFSGRITKPLKMLTEAARKVAKGNFDTKVRLKGQDELNELADAFNTMTQQIKNLFNEVNLQKEELNGIIKSLHDGLVVINKDDNIILCNDAFGEIVGRKRIEGLFYWEAIRNPEFTTYVKKIKKARNNLTSEFVFNGRHYLCNSNFIEAKDEIVFIIYDISQIKNLEQIKKDIVQNVSHELRTPLTAIKGFIETLEEDIGDNSRHYLDIIKRHTDRLINIVNDLLTLSKLEEPGSSLVLNNVNIRLLVDNILPLFTQKLSEKNLVLNVSIEENLQVISADSFKLEQMMINLIDNAIKYTDEGTISISVSLGNNLLKIIVEDTGIGIPPEHLDRIFERFYTVDKSRSRKLGGTGLGLSIVKHIILLHKGTIRIESQQGKGTKFIISLPVKVKEKVV